MKKHIALFTILCKFATSPTLASEFISPPSNSQQTQLTPPAYKEFTEKIKRDFCALLLRQSSIARMRKHDCEINNDKLFEYICKNQFLLYDPKIKENQSLAALCINSDHLELLARLIEYFPETLNLNIAVSKRLLTGEKYQLPIIQALYRKRRHSSLTRRQHETISYLLNLIKSNMPYDDTEQYQAQSSPSQDPPPYKSWLDQQKQNQTVPERFQHNPYLTNTQPNNR